MGLFNRSKQQESLESGLEKTRSSFFGKINKLVRGKDQVDDELLDDLEQNFAARTRKIASGEGLTLVISVAKVNSRKVE